MNHETLLAEGVPITDARHLEVARERFRELQRDHAKRLANVKLEKRMVMGDVWQNAQGKDERRITSALPHNIIRMSAAMMMPQPPAIAVAPLGSSKDAAFQADQTTKWIYAALDNLQAFTDVYPAFAKELAFGAGILHMYPDRDAVEDEEVPVILDSVESSAVLYHHGPRHQVDYCFVRYQMACGDIERNFGKSPKAYTYSKHEKVDVWAYYSEERIRVNNRTNRMVLYTVLECNEFLYPLTDITSILPEIPVFVALNADGYNWQGAEHMRALGMLTSEQSRLLFANDYFTQLAESMIRNTDPPMIVKQDPNTNDIRPDKRAGAYTAIGLQEDIKPMMSALPNDLVHRYGQELARDIAFSTNRHVSPDTGDMQNISGSAWAEMQHPDVVLTATRQSVLGDKISRQITLMLRHLAATMEPGSSLTLRGLDPRDKKQIEAAATPELLAAAKHIRVELTNQTPAGLIKHVTLIQNLAGQNLIPKAMATEMICRWMKLPVTNMTDVVAEIANDQSYEAQLELQKAQAMALLPHLRQQMNQDGLNPNALQDGSSRYQLASSAQDPYQNVHTDIQGPVQQYNNAQRMLAEG